MTEEYIQVLTTTGKKEEADKIANAVVAIRLGACAQILGPIVSTYWWKGSVETAEEWMCLVKTKRNLFDRLEKTIKEIHSYQTPEIIAIPIVAGSNDYLEWLRNEVQNVT